MPGNEYYLALQDRSSQYEGPHAELVQKTPDLFLLLQRMLVDRRVAGHYKAYIGQALSYITAPLDVLHDDFIGKATYLDDLCVAAAVLRVISRCLSGQLIDEHWHGSYELTEMIDRVVTDADQLIGQGRLQLILESVGVVLDAKEKYALDDLEWS